jgi:hypothetical protein
MHGSEKLSHTVTVAATADLAKLPIGVPVKGKTTLADRGSRSSGGTTVGFGPHRNGVDERGGYELDAEATRFGTISRERQAAPGCRYAYAAHRCGPLPGSQGPGGISGHRDALHPSGSDGHDAGSGPLRGLSHKGELPSNPPSRSCRARDSKADQEGPGRSTASGLGIVNRATFERAWRIHETE